MVEVGSIQLRLPAPSIVRLCGEVVAINSVESCTVPYEIRDTTGVDVSFISRKVVAARRPDVPPLCAAVG